MTANTVRQVQKESRTKAPEPYPFVGAPLEGHLLGYIGVKRGPNGDTPIFAFQHEESVDNSLVEIAPDGTISAQNLETKVDIFVRLNGAPAPIPEPAPPRRPLSLPPTSPVFRTARAVAARQAAVAGREAQVETFMTEVLGLWRGARWHEPVSTALLGDWVGSLHTDGRILPGALEQLEAEARLLHRQLTPLWERKCRGERLRSLDFALGDGLTIYDLVADGPDPYEVLFGALPEDARLVVVLAELTPTERAVAMAWANPQTTSWADAAAHVIELDPSGCAGHLPIALGERVRRKLKRLGERHTRRVEETPAIWQGGPS
ncbi:hypothetical protein [Streptomyces sp. NPDC037389]|uniref:hypothetical protein n=1 Tax=Streptomyces sp. NPDC037389 TaxID=3155369 RepID=UPI0033FC754B